MSKRQLPPGAWDWEVFDQLPADIRDLVCEFGQHVVRQFLNAGVPADRIRHLVYTVWVGSREQPPCRQGGSGDRNLNAALASGSIATAKALRGFLAHTRIGLVPLSPSRAMLDASLAAVASYGVLSKEQKHRVRLEAAIRAEQEAGAR